MTQRAKTTSALITGAGGKLGQMLRRAWGNGGQFTYLSRSPNADVQWRPGQPLPALPPVDTVIALWGVTSGSAQALAVNAGLARHALDLAQASGAARLFHLSSAAVYGPGVDVSEDAALQPANPYGQAKIDMEKTVAAQTAPGITQCCLRLANVVGADSLAAGLQGPGPITLPAFADGLGPQRSYVSPGLLAEILSALAALPAADLPAVLNVAAPDPVGMADLALAVGKRITWRDETPADTQCVTMNTAGLCSLLPGLDTRRTPAQMIAEWTRLRTPG